MKDRHMVCEAVGPDLDTRDDIRFLCPECGEFGALAWVEKMDDSETWFVSFNCLKCGAVHKKTWQFSQHRLVTTVLHLAYHYWRQTKVNP